MQKYDKAAIEQDFSRDVWCVLGLPLDCLDLCQTCDFLESSIRNNRQVILSTPNIDWIVKILFSSDFKKAVIKSDYCVIDSFPLLLVARFLGFSSQERVPGSSLVEYFLSNLGHKQYSIFWFGGESGVAEKACEKINSMNLGIKAVGFYYPGFGSVEEMSEEGIISEINEKNPDLLLVALGARKGAIWIDKNKDKLNAKVLCHVGATVNFVAGTEKRAPVWIRNLGFEWLWRIFQEPYLCKRYAKDAVVLFYLLISRVIPHVFFLRKNKKYLLIKKPPAISIEDRDSDVAIKIQGTCNVSNSEEVKNYFIEIASKDKDVVVDFADTEYVDNYFLGLLLVLQKYQWIKKKKLTVLHLERKLKSIFRYNLLDLTYYL